MPQIDLSAVKGGEVPESGSYHVKYTGFKNELTPENGKTPYTNVEFTIMDEDSKFKGQKLWRKFYWSENALIFFKMFAKIIGQPFTGTVDTDEVFKKGAGADLMVDVETAEADNGKVYANIKKFYAYEPWKS